MTTYDFAKTKVLYQWKTEHPLIACRMGPSGKEVVASLEDSSISRWLFPEKEGAEPVKQILAGHDSWVHALVYSRDGKQLITGGCEGKILWWDLSDSGAPPKIVRSVQAHTGWIRAIDISPDGGTLVSVGNDRVIRFWNIATGEMSHRIENAHDRHIYCVNFHPSRPEFITADLLGKIHIWNWDTNGPGTTPLRTIDASALYAENKGQNAEYGGVRTFAYDGARNELIAGGCHKATNPFAAVNEPLLLRYGYDAGDLRKSHACDGIAGGMIWRAQWLNDGTSVAVSGGGSGGILLFFQDTQEKEVHRFMLPSLARDMDLHNPTGLIATAHFDNHLRITQLSQTS
jgi:WD40 repeat protein